MHLQGTNFKILRIKSTLHFTCSCEQITPCIKTYNDNKMQLAVKTVETKLIIIIVLIPVATHLQGTNNYFCAI